MNFESGCYVDGLHGIYVPMLVTQIAREFGWDRFGLVERVTRSMCQDDATLAYEIADDAISYLNEQCSEDGFSWGWHEGGLYYWHEKDWSAE